MIFHHVDFLGPIFLVLWVFSGSLAFTFILTSLLLDSLDSEERDLVETTHLGLNVPKTLTLCLISVSGSEHLFPYAAGRSFSDDG